MTEVMPHVEDKDLDAFIVEKLTSEACAITFIFLENGKMTNDNLTHKN